MKKPTTPVPNDTPPTPPTVVTAKVQEEKISASGRWGAVHRVRLPYKNGLPLGSGGCGDNIER